MYWREHGPPHFHAKYGGLSASFRIDPPAFVRGRFPAKVQALVLTWAALHREELLANWERARRLEAPVAIPGLP